MVIDIVPDTRNLTSLLAGRDCNEDIVYLRVETKSEKSNDWFSSKLHVITGEQVTAVPVAVTVKCCTTLLIRPPSIISKLRVIWSLIGLQEGVCHLPHSSFFKPYALTFLRQILMKRIPVTKKKREGRIGRISINLNNLSGWKILAIITILGLKYKYPAAL
jgi:hypothetical protein